MHVSVITRWIATHHGKATLARTIKKRYEKIQDELTSQGGGVAVVAEADQAAYNELERLRDVIPEETRDHEDAQRTGYVPLATPPMSQSSEARRVWINYLASEPVTA